MSRNLLTQAVELLEVDYGRRGVFLIHAADLGFDASRIFAFEELTERYAKLLTHVFQQDRLRGIVTSLSSQQLLGSTHKVRALEAVEKDHGVMQSTYPAEVVATYANHLSACLERRYEEALATASSELQRLEIAVTQAIIGDIDLAQASVQSLTESERRQNLLLVITIELYRRGRVEEGDRLRAAHTPMLDDEFSLVFMALGASNRAPWICYPYPDY